MLVRSQVVGNAPSADAVTTADSRSANAKTNASPLFILNILPVLFLVSLFPNHPGETPARASTEPSTLTRAPDSGS